MRKMEYPVGHEWELSVEGEEEEEELEFIEMRKVRSDPFLRLVSFEGTDGTNV